MPQSGWTDKQALVIPVAGQPLSSQLLPQSRLDMLSWSRAEAGQYSLDWQAGILYELNMG